jgi:hypothetical protein
MMAVAFDRDWLLLWSPAGAASSRLSCFFFLLLFLYLLLVFVVDAVRVALL